MATHLLLLLLVATTPLAAAAAASLTVTLVNSTTEETPTAYEMLVQYDFPRGILPEGVQGYVLRPDGSFEVYLPAGDCQFRVAGRYTLHYSSRVAGGIRVGSIGGLDGVKVKVAFVWLRVRQVDRDGDQLRFSVGRITKSFPLDSFFASPRCD